MSITIIVGKPGAGKTLFATNIISNKMLDSSEDLWCYKYELKRLQNGGFSYLEMPPQRHLCYADYCVKVNKRLEAYSIDGYKIGLPNPYFITQFIAPYSTIVLDEAQRYFDSRNSKLLRPEVYNFFQLHRQNHYNIILVCQRLANIDVNIRDLAEKIIVINDLSMKEDKYGRIYNFKWKIKEFESPEVAKDYCEKKDNEEYARLGKDLIITSDLPLFDFYSSYSNKPAFYNGNELKNFDFDIEERYITSVESFANYNSLHSFTAPQGYWKSAEYDKKINKKLEINT